MSGAALLGRVGAPLVLAGLLALQGGRDAIRVDAARGAWLVARAGAGDAEAAAAYHRAEGGAAARARLARIAVAAGQAMLLAGLLLAAAYDRAPWGWRLMLGWCLVVLFAAGELPVRLR